MIFLRFFYDSCQKHQFYDVFLRVRVTKYRKLHAYMRGRGANTGAKHFDSALQIDRENPFSVNTDWGMSILLKWREKFVMLPEQASKHLM